MKTLKYYWIIALLCFAAQTAFAEESRNMDTGFSNRVFVVETDEASATESLNRISGDIDLGFSAPEYSYESENHARHDPLEDRESSPRA